MKIALIVPAYNESERIAAVLQRIPRRIQGHRVTVFVVSDGSRDGTVAAVHQVAGVRLIEHASNVGKGAAAKTGCDAAYASGMDVLCLMDADGQHQPEDIERMVTPLLAGKRVLVTGMRTKVGNAPLVRRLGNKVIQVVLFTLFGIRLRDAICGFRAFHRESYEALRWESSTYEMEMEMAVLATKANIPFVEVPIATIYHESFKGMTVFDGMRIVRTILKWRLR